MSVLLSKVMNIFTFANGSIGTLLASNVDNLVDANEVTAAGLSVIVEFLLTVLGNLVYYIAQFALGLMDFFQFVIYKFLGITIDVTTFKVLDLNNPLIRFLSNETVSKVLTTMFSIAIVLVIVFSILSIIMGEYNRAANSGEYSVKMVWSRAIRSIFGMAVFPVAFMAVIILLNALLASFSAALSNNTSTSLGGRVFATSAYNANAYRNYADNNRRIPIYIDFDDPYDNGTMDRYSKEELVEIYDAFSDTGIDLYNKFASNSFATFNEAVTYNYSNNSLTNNKDAFGTYEKFICTAEQYYVMADFIDYAMANNVTYYYKSVSDPDIEWKYVDNTIYNPENGSLTITYKDASNISNGAESYTVSYNNAYAISTPIQDALGTLGSVLSLDGTYYSMLEHLDGTINQVAWATDQVKVQLSENCYDTSKWTVGDQILLYEYYRYNYNNTFSGYSLNQLEKGVYLDAYTIECQFYRDYSDNYVTLKTYKVVIINNNYYLIEEARDAAGEIIYDSYGDPYYQIANHADTGTLLYNLSNYNKENQAEVGVHIAALDSRDETTGEVTNEAWYSATYTGDAVEAPQNSFVYYMANTIGEEYTVKVEEEPGVVIEQTKYGFADANGYMHPVDEIKAVVDIKKVGWAQKLIGDLQVLYKDLNLKQLVTTGEWLEVFNSTIDMVDGKYIASFDTSMISPIGLVLSEIFMGTVQEGDGTTLGTYKFGSKYSDAQKREIVLALVGEENYETVSFTLDYFVDMFNMLFEPLLEQIMWGQNQPLMIGDICNVQLYTYKAYLCSILLSTDSASFFLDITDELLVMYEFAYDILLTEPGDYTLAMNLLKEYLSTYVLNQNIYGYGGSNLPFSYNQDLSTMGLDKLIVKYLDTEQPVAGPNPAEVAKDGVVTAEDIIAIYGSTNLSDITYDRTASRAIELLIAINEKISTCYRSFADIVIDENVNNKLIYGFDFDLSPYKIWGQSIFESNPDGTYSFNTRINSIKNVNSYNQLEDIYNTICRDIYAEMKSQFEANNNEILTIAIYNNVKNNLAEQNTTEDSLSWPAYMTNYKAYLLGELEYAEIYFSSLIDVEPIITKMNDYKKHFKKYEQALKTLNKTTLLSNIKVSEIYDFEAMRINLINGVTRTVLNALEHEYGIDLTDFTDKITTFIEDIITASPLNAIVDGIINGVGNILGSQSANVKEDSLAAKISETCYNWLYDQAELDRLLDAFYGSHGVGDEDYYMDKQTLIEYSGLKSANKKIKNTIKGYLTQQDIQSQLSAIVAYSINNGTKTPIGDHFVYDFGGYKVPESALIFLQNLGNSWSGALARFKTVSQYHKYHIPYAVRMKSTENVARTFKVTVNNNIYNLTIKMPTAKLTEYLVGGKYLDYLQFETVYVDKSYTGFFDIDYNDDNTIKKPDHGEANFSSITDFLTELADLTMSCYYMSNLWNITDENLNKKTVSELFYYTQDGANYLSNDISHQSCMKLALLYILQNEYFSIDQARKVIGDYGYDYETFIASVSNMRNTDVQNAYNSVIGYLTGVYKDYHNLTMKEIRLDLMDALIHYQPDSASNNEENKNRYVTLFYFFCSDFTFVNIGTTDGATGDDKTQVRYTKDITTQNLVLELAGLSDMPVELLVGLEYENLYHDNDGFDENNGDFFVICTYDEEMQNYVPFLMRPAGSSDAAYIDPIDEKHGNNWLEVYGYGHATTEYYYSGAENSAAYPVIAKGVITESGYPTAIRQVNGITEFYRDDVIIRNASDLNLSTYYMAVENLSTNYNLVNALFNSMVQLFTGKTLVEHAYGNVPRFNLSGDLNLPMGVNSYNVALTGEDITIDYTFGSIRGLSSQHFYQTLKINFIVLLLAILSLLPMLLKALFAIFGRVIDVTFYYCISPVMFSTMALGKNTVDKDDKPVEETRIFTAWYQKLKDKTLSIFGYVVGFQIFFILIPFIFNMTFITDANIFDSIPYLSDISVSFVNTVIQVVFLICSVYLITQAPAIFAKVMGQTDGFKEGENVKKNIEGTLNQVKDVVTGQATVNAVQTGFQTVKDVSGYTAARGAASAVKQAGTKVASKGMEYYMRAKGVQKAQAKQLTKDMYAQVKAHEEKKRKRLGFK